MNDKQTIEITTGTLLRGLLLVALAIFLYTIRAVVGIVLFAVVIASAIEPATHWFMAHRVPRILGVLFIYLFAFVVIGSAFYVIVPSLYEELSDFAMQSPQYIQKSIFDHYLLQTFPELPAAVPGYVSELIAGLKQPLESTGAGFLQAISSLFGGALSFVMILVISFYLSVQEHGIENFLRIVTPKEYESYILDLWARSRTKMGRWLQGQILLGLLVGVLVFLGLTILQVKYALILAMLSAMFELIPVFGPIMAAIPAIAIAFIQKPVLGLIVLVFYIIVQQFENHLIYPLVVRQTVGVSPLLVVLSLLIGMKTAGVIGFMLAVPVAAVLVELATDIAKRKQIA